MKARLGLLILAMVMFATTSFGQGGINPYSYVPLYEHCDGTGAPLPDGTPFYIYIDVDSDGPDATDPLAPVCPAPPDCLPLTWSDNVGYMNGVEVETGPGTFYSYTIFNILLADLIPNRVYFRVVYTRPAMLDQITYTSNVIVGGVSFAGGAPNEVEITSWTCSEPICCTCADEDSLFMPNPVGPLGPQPVNAMFCVYSSPIIHLFIGPFLESCQVENPEALTLLQIMPGCDGSAETGVWASDTNNGRGQWVLYGQQHYIRVDLIPNWAPGQTRGCATITPDYLLSNGSYDCWLPVEMGNVTVTPRDGAVEIQWATRSESGLTRFEILRDQAAIAMQPAANAATGAAYHYTDRNVDNGHAYTYELVVVNADGSRETVYTAENIVPSADKAVVTEYALHANYPNPFNPATTIAYDLLDAGDVSLLVFNLMGQKVADLARGPQAAGRHTVSFDGANLPSGVYLYQLRAGTFVAEQKMLLLK